MNKLTSNLTPQEELTVASYDQHAKQWSSEHDTSDFWKDELDLFQKYLPKGKILEIGCGGGRDAKELIARGYNYIGTDVSEGFVKEAKARLPNTIFLVQSAYDLKFKNEFDGFWSSATLLHIPHNRINEALKSINKTLKPGAIGFISIKQGIGEQVFDEQLHDGTPISRFFSFYQPDEFKEILLKNGFETLDSKIRPISVRTTWLIYIVKAI